jgi:hypothetical protein
LRSLIKIILILCLVALSVTESRSQGFDWQFSSRLPSDYPEYFLGFSGGYEHSLHDGNIVLDDTQFDCCQFETGSGPGFFVGLTGEYWLGGHFAVNAKLLYINSSSTFLKQADPIPIIGSEDLITEYEFRNTLSYVNFELSGKYRLLESHFHVGATLFLGVKVTEKNEYFERVVQGGPFNDGTTEKVLEIANTPDVRSIYFMPKINFGYDVDLGLGKYMTPQVSVGLPIISISETTSWDRFSLSAGVSVYWAMW